MSGLIHFVLAYDIQDDDRRNALFKALGRFGYRVQFSVLEGRLKPEDFVKLRYAVKNIINPKDDRVLILVLCENCQKKMIRMGTQTDMPDQDIVII